MQQFGNKGARVGDESDQSILFYSDVDAVGLREECAADGQVECVDASVAIDNEKPSLLACPKTPIGIRRQLDPLVCKMRIRNQKRPRNAKAFCCRTSIGGACSCGRKGFCAMQFSASAMVEKTKCRVAAGRGRGGRGARAGGGGGAGRGQGRGA